VRFFLEVTGHGHDNDLTKALDTVNKDGSTVKILGSYPASSWVE
jgi:prephenate dehydratase